MVAASTTLDNLAMQASEQSGLPQPFVKALIEAEGTYGPGGPNNPFDVTNSWANDTGFGGFVTGLWNILAPGVGVAIFSNPSAAIQSWAKGIATMPAYAQFRTDVQNGAPVTALVQDLGVVGYAGGSNSWIQNVLGLYEKNSGQSASLPLSGGTTATTTTTQGQGQGKGQGQTQGQTQTQVSATALAQPWGQVSLTNPFAGVANAITDLGAIPIKAMAAAEAFGWIIIGLLIAIAGLWLLVKGEENHA